jgi:dihydrofolate reductase
MGKWIVYIAMSLDGYIAGKKWKMDRLNDFPNPNALEYGYPDLIEGIDTILMWKNTYVEILKLKEERPYKDCATYVMSRDPDLEIKTPNTQILNGLSPETVIKLHAKSKKNIWILWWWQVVSQCLEIGAVDEMVVSVLPVLLWKWIPLFTNMNKIMWLDLVKTESFDTGIVMLHYKKKEEVEE